MLAKIATHLDQVVDVFYVTEQGGKLDGPERPKEVQSTLLTTLEEFEQREWQRFAS